MVFTLLLTSMPFLTQKTEAQESNDVLVNYETMPEYPGGNKKWKQDSEAYMETRLRNMFPQANPDSLATDERKRRIVVQCIIDKEGIAQDPIILPGHGLHPTIDEMVINRLSKLLTAEEKKTMLEEAKAATSWIYEYIKLICRS